MKQFEKDNFVVIRRLPDSCNNCQFISTCRKNVVGSEKFFGKILYSDNKSADVCLALIKDYTSCVSDTIQIPLEYLRVHPQYHTPGRYKFWAIDEGNLNVDDQQFQKLKELIKSKPQPIFVIEYTNSISLGSGLIFDIRGFFEDDELENIYCEIEEDIFVLVHPQQLKDPNNQDKIKDEGEDEDIIL